MNQELEQTKRLSITDENSPKNVAFIEKLEKEKGGVKMYYYMWLSRLFIFFATVSLAILMSSSLSLFKLAPKVFVEPVLIINQDTSEGIVRAEAIVNSMISKDTVLEIFMKQYVILRNTIFPDKNEMMSRWAAGGLVNFLSSNKVYSEFAAVAYPQMKDEVSKKISRSVEIESIGKVGGARSPIWKVNFKTYELSPYNVDGNVGAQTLTTRYWTASIRATFFNERMFLARRLLNPLGFTVIDYSQAEVNVF